MIVLLWGIDEVMFVSEAIDFVIQMSHESDSYGKSGFSE